MQNQNDLNPLHGAKITFINEQRDLNITSRIYEPFTLPKLPLGDYKIIINKEGYEEYTTEITFNGGHVQLQVELTPLEEEPKKPKRKRKRTKNKKEDEKTKDKKKK